METEAIFENIAERIQQEIISAESSIFIAVAWFTNQILFDELIIKAKKGCKVSLIISNDEINSNSSINYENLNIGSSQVFKIGDGRKELMHHKFCVIDHDIVITGSYNWSYKAENNFETTSSLHIFFLNGKIDCKFYLVEIYPSLSSSPRIPT